MSKIFDIKDDIVLEDLMMMQPALLILYTATILYCNEYSLPCTFTSFMSDRENVKQQTKTHEEGRAFDMSTIGWTEMHINRFVHMINTDYRDIAAVSARDGIARAAVYHNYKSQGDHIHLQVRRDAKVNKFVKYNF